MVKSVLLVIFSVVLGVGGQLSLKTGMNQVGRIGGEFFSNPITVLMKIAGTPIVVFGFFLYLISALVWLIVLSRENLSFVYPLIGMSYVFVIFFSRILFNEPVTLTRWIGTAVILIGVIIVTRSHGGGG